MVKKGCVGLFGGQKLKNLSKKTLKGLQVVKKCDIIGLS